MTASNFDRAARLYRYAEYLTLGPLLQRTRTHFLPQLTHVHRALVLGDGDGRFLARLLHENRNLRVLAIDTSAVMLKLLTRRCHAVEANVPRRLRTWQGSALGITPAHDTDLIVTHFFLDCFTQPEIDALAVRLAQHTQPGTLWLLSDFRIPHNPLQPFARAYIRSLYFAFRILTNLPITHLPNPATALTAAGFHRLTRHETLGGILYTELWQQSPSKLTSSKL